MDLEQEKNTQSEEQHDAQEAASGESQKSLHGSGRPQRPRIRVQHSYNQSHRDDEGGFRPEGFGAALMQGTGGGGRASQQRDDYASRPYRPRTGGANGGRDGYQQRPQGYRPRYGDGAEGYQKRPQGYRPRYGGAPGEQKEGYRQRTEGYQQRPQGYRPRYGGAPGEQKEGYQQRPQGYQQRPQGYRPRYGGAPGEQKEGYQPKQQGYRPRYGAQDGEQQQRKPWASKYGANHQQGGYKGGWQPRTRTAYIPNTYKPNPKKRIDYGEENINPDEPIRLNKYLANAGVCSRREADEHIQAGDVLVNGTVVTELGTKVKRTDVVTFKDKPVTLEKKVYILLNKPKGCITSTEDPQQRKTVLDLVAGACPERIYPVGRLDLNTTGVLLLTNDGDLASKLTHPQYLKKKVYHVFLDRNVTEHDMKQITEGIELEDGEIRADSVEYAGEDDKSQVGIEIHSGKNRIVRRIFESLGYRVIKLDRVQFAGLTKKNLRRGDWRFLTEKEVNILRMGSFE